MIGKARLLAVQIIEGDRQLRLLRQARDLLAERYNLTRHAVAQGNASLDTVSPDLTALSATRQQIDDLTRLQQTRRHDLNALLGLAPDVALPLAPEIDLPPIDPAAVETDAACPARPAAGPGRAATRLCLAGCHVARRHPGAVPGADHRFHRRQRHQQRAHLRPQITIDLPIFDRNQGDIAIARATRRQLHDEFSARLATATGQVQAMLADIALLQRQIRTQRGQLAETDRVARQADAAFRAGNLTERAYVDFVTARPVHAGAGAGAAAKPAGATGRAGHADRRRHAQRHGQPRRTIPHHDATAPTGLGAAVRLHDRAGRRGRDGERAGDDHGADAGSGAGYGGGVRRRRRSARATRSLLSVQHQGHVQNLAATVGETVAAGAPLLQVTASPAVVAAYHQAQSALALAQTQRAHATQCWPSISRRATRWRRPTRR